MIKNLPSRQPALKVEPFKEFKEGERILDILTQEWYEIIKIDGDTVTLRDDCGKTIPRTREYVNKNFGRSVVRDVDNDVDEDDATNGPTVVYEDPNYRSTSNHVRTTRESVNHVFN